MYLLLKSQEFRALPHATALGYAFKNKPAEGCPVCLRTSCMLKTHRDYARQSTKGHAKISDDQDFMKILSVPVTIDGGRVNAFLNLPVSSSDTESYRYFSEFFTSQSISITDPHRKPAFDLDFCPILFQQALKDPATAHTCIAMGATYEAVHGLNLEAPNQKLLAIYARTFQSLRQQLENGRQKTSEATVAGAINLVMCHGVGFGDVLTLETHLRGARALIKEAGGLHNLGSQSITLVLWCDYWNTLFTGKKPFFASEWNVRVDIPLTSPPPVMHGLAFENLASRGIIPTNLLDVCLNTCRLTELLEDKMNHTSTQARWQYFQYKRNTVAMRNGVVYAELFGTASKAECINIAINLYFLLVLRLVPWRSPILTLCNQLRAALIGSDLSDLWGKDSKALTWVVFMLLAGSELGENRKWALELLLSLLIAKYRIKLGSWTAIWRENEKETLMQFVWSNSFFATSFKTTCRDLGRIQSSSAPGH